MTTIKSLRNTIDPAVSRASGAIRRMAIAATNAVLWQLAGVRMLDGSTETRTAEPFTGIGFYARPPAGGKPEAIVVMVGDARAPMIVGVRDEATRAKIAAAIATDETMVFNSVAIVYLKADGTIELRTPTGIAEKMLKGETYRAAENTFFTAIQTFSAAVNALGVALALYVAGIKPLADPTNAFTPAMLTAIAAIEAAAGALGAAVATFEAASATYLATVGRVE